MLHVGQVLAGRFTLERRAGSGGMGQVWKARDRASSEAVAIKVLLEGHARGRFAREAEGLAEISHPGIVRYVAHGETPAGELFLAMEWLEGEDLASRLRRIGLTLKETVTLGKRVAEALAAAHARGVVHRDLKPSNIFLVDKDVGRVKILDFGIAWFSAASRMTQTGVVLGTPGYMAPEQARGGSDIDARVDVFTLGSVLFECLTGQKAFAGDHFMAILAKILFHPPPPVRELRPEVPAEIEALVTRMLAKDPDERPRDGAAVAEALEVRGAPIVEDPAPGSARSVALTGDERRALCVVLIAPGKPAGEDDEPPSATDPQVVSVADALRREAEACGGRVELLADGGAVVTLSGAKVPTDQAAQAARCAIALREICPDRPMALSTGRAEVTGSLPVGDAIDRAARALARLEQALSAAPVLRRAAPITVDEVTAALLDARFELIETDAGMLLRCERVLAEGARTLLGRTTACVGRDWEISTLEQFFVECVEETRARPALVTAPAGMGKSRIAYELINRARRHGEGAAIWIGRGDPLRAGAAFGLIGQALRGALGIQGGEPLAARREKVRARVAESVPARDRDRVAEFLGELVGSPFPDEGSVGLQTARRDAQLMGEQMRRAWEDFLAAESARRPVLLVLEDLHWGDMPTVKLVDGALRRQRERPWMVLALARPEVHALFPRIWAERGLQEIRLKELTRKASARLVRQVLGDAVDEDTIERLVSQADGNAFYLEELIRAADEARGAALPETVVTMVQSRIDGLEAAARRVLRAASIFGEVFWEGGVAALLGEAPGSRQVSDWLKALVEREVLVPRVESRFPGEPELAFRHALLREGAYAMLTDEDRALGHMLAASWLEQRGEEESLVLAEHCERGREPLRAGKYYLRAAEQALHGGDTDAVFWWARRGLSCGPPGETRGEILSLLGEAHVLRSEFSAAAPYVEEAVRLTPPGGVSWARATHAKLLAEVSLRPTYDEKLDAIRAAIRAMSSATPAPGGAGVVAQGLYVAGYVAGLFQRRDLAETAVHKLQALADETGDRDPLVRAFLLETHAWWQSWARDDPWAALTSAQAALAIFKEINHSSHIAETRLWIAMDYEILGALERSEQELRAVQVPDEGLAVLSVRRDGALARVLLLRGALDEAHALGSSLVDRGRARSMPLVEGQGRLTVVEIQRIRGDLAEAERGAREVVEALAAWPLERMLATATLVKVLLAEGAAGEALALAEETLASHEALGIACYLGGVLRCLHAQALHAAGYPDRARAAITAARDRIVTMAERIGDPALRRTFLEGASENARTLALAREWLGAEPAAG